MHSTSSMELICRWIAFSLALPIYFLDLWEAKGSLPNYPEMIYFYSLPWISNNFKKEEQILKLMRGQLPKRSKRIPCYAVRDLGKHFQRSARELKFKWELTVLPVSFTVFFHSKPKLKWGWGQNSNSDLNEKLSFNRTPPHCRQGQNLLFIIVDLNQIPVSSTQIPTFSPTL